MVITFTRQRTITPSFFSLLLIMLIWGTPPVSASEKPAETFQITQQSFENFQLEGIPDEIIKKLEKIAGQEFIGEKRFLDVLGTTLGDSLTTLRYKSAILKFAEKPVGVQDLEVTKIYARDDKLALHRTIQVEISNLAKWISQGHKASEFILYIDGTPFNGLTPSFVEGKKLQFELKFEKDPENKKVWTSIVSRRGQTGGFFERKVPVTVGFKNDIQIQNNNADITLVRVKGRWFWGFAITFGLGIVFFIQLSRKSDIIRDTGPVPEGLDEKGRPKRKPYSLARTQMALWFFVVVMSYVFIWMVTDDLTNLTPSVLGLIGISAATGLGSAVVDSNKRSEQQNQRRVLEEQKKKIELEVERLKNEISTLGETELADRRAELATKEKEIEQINQKIKGLPGPAKPMESKRFVKDILSDDDGVSFHRFQIFVWTIVLIAIFIMSVYNSLTMPEFDATLLALMGISGGTYIGFKLPEQQA